jgi:hypothetical protein
VLVDCGASRLRESGTWIAGGKLKQIWNQREEYTINKKTAKKIFYFVHYSVIVGLNHYKLTENRKVSRFTENPYIVLAGFQIQIFWVSISVLTTVPFTLIKIIITNSDMTWATIYINCLHSKQIKKMLFSIKWITFLFSLYGWNNQGKCRRIMKMQ